MDNRTDFTQSLEEAISSLVAEGKQPSVALVKSRLGVAVPMPLIITALQRWKKNGVVPKVEKVASEKSDSQRISELESKVYALEKQIAELETKIADKPH
ncbi:hypothetical protein CS022_15135 [Veronia nyctiphanis]|uniref:KfrA N-terminal DNA-binding domain-containing protein n=1 Tax=Veronia nyctiphanis TaxID=1278244 RepID=A0A4Q0YTN5_9GAMM|nr:hypothetical protein [Veronia nyctiphanis]RXJ72519.1 hypothetical protein CS022_15135 [Veronia nyctiphanis]